MHGIIATTTPDRQGDVFTRDALVQVVAAQGAAYVPIRFEHDIRCPPIARSVAVRLIDRPDGTSALEADFECFERTDSPTALKGDGRRLSLPFLENPGPAVWFDGVPPGNSATRSILEIVRVLGIPRGPTERFKKSLDPVSGLLIAAGVYVGGKILEGFLNRIGEEGFNRLAKALEELRRTSNGPKNYEIVFVVDEGGHRCQVHVVLPADHAFDDEAALRRAARALDERLPQLEARKQRIVQVVFDCSGDDLQLLYTVRDDGVPNPLSAIPDVPWERQGLSVEGLLGNPPSTWGR